MEQLHRKWEAPCVVRLSGSGQAAGGYVAGNTECQVTFVQHIGTSFPALKSNDIFKRGSRSAS